MGKTHKNVVLDPKNVSLNYVVVQFDFICAFSFGTQIQVGGVDFSCNNLSSFEAERFPTAEFSNRLERYSQNH